MEDMGLVPDLEDPDPGATVECRRSYWTYTDRGGLLDVHPHLAAHVAQGETVATLFDLWGRPIRTYTAPEAGVVVGKSSNPAAHAGSRILHLGIPGPPE